MKDLSFLNKAIISAMSSIEKEGMFSKTQPMILVKRFGGNIYATTLDSCRRGMKAVGKKGKLVEFGIAVRSEQYQNSYFDPQVKYLLEPYFSEFNSLRSEQEALREREKKLLIEAFKKTNKLVLTEEVDEMIDKRREFLSK